MSNQTAAWRVPDADRPPEQFWIDFGNFVMASMRQDDTDHYWETLAKWADVLCKRYHGNDVVAHLIIDYLDGQDKRSKQLPGNATT